MSIGTAPSLKKVPIQNLLEDNKINEVQDPQPLTFKKNYKMAH